MYSKSLAIKDRREITQPLIRAFPSLLPSLASDIVGPFRDPHPPRPSKGSNSHHNGDLNVEAN